MYNTRLFIFNYIFLMLPLWLYNSLKILTSSLHFLSSEGALENKVFKGFFSMISLQIMVIITLSLILFITKLLWGLPECRK